MLSHRLDGALAEPQLLADRRHGTPTVPRNSRPSSVGKLRISDELQRAGGDTCNVGTRLRRNFRVVSSPREPAPGGRPAGRPTDEGERRAGRVEHRPQPPRAGDARAKAPSTGWPPTGGP